VALALLDVVIAERRRLPDGATALHDFRVALRRLRSWLRACQPWLRDTVRGRTGRALSEIADASNVARDAEVGLAWVEAQRGLPARSGKRARRLAARLRLELRVATHRFDEQLARDFTPAVRRLEAELRETGEEPSGDSRRSPRARDAHAAMIREHAADLAAALYRVQTIDDAGFAHRARITGKRLRYLLEPLSGDPHARQVVRRLRRLQDALGEFHDAFVLGERLHRADAALERRARERTVLAFARVKRGWLGARAKDLLAAI
jgi:CHAD domain-containing protein